MGTVDTTTLTGSPIFADANVHVSSSRVILNNTTYAMSNITSVRALKKSPDRKVAILLIVVGVVLWFPSHILGLILLALGVLLLLVLKTNYTVLIGTSSGERNALSSKDGGYITKIVDAINQAIIARG